MGSQIDYGMIFQENNKAIYIQIADRIADQILQRDYPPGSRLPSVRDLAADMQVNANTVMRSFERLSLQGLIFNRRGIGFFVSDDAADRILASRGEDLLSNRLQDIFELLSRLGITPDQLAYRYRTYLESR